MATHLFPEVIKEIEKETKEVEEIDTDRKLAADVSVKSYRILLNKEQQKKYVDQEKGIFVGEDKIFVFLKETLQGSNGQLRTDKRSNSIEITKYYVTDEKGTGEFVDMLLLTDTTQKKKTVSTNRNLISEEVSEEPQEQGCFSRFCKLFKRII